MENLIIDAPGWTEDGVGECVSHYISLAEIDDKLPWFIDQCISGIGKIIKVILASLLMSQSSPHKCNENCAIKRRSVRYFKR